jgi:cytochrome c-type biogenesis protein CcmE
MTRKNRRAVFILTGLAILGIAVGLILYATSSGITFFYSPSEMAQKHIEPGTRVRLGGMVEKGSVKQAGPTVTFKVTDFVDTMTVSYTGILPDLFREGQGVVCEGKLLPNGTFLADTVLAKHDEKYMPPQVADALKKVGRTKDGELIKEPSASTPESSNP